MNRTISKFKRLQDRLAGKKSHSVEVPYEIECDCGTVVKGIRRTSWIEPECEACAQTVFVLPMNVYPSTKSVPSEILGGTFRERLKIVSQELLKGRASEGEAEPDDTQPDAKTKATGGEDVVAKAKWKLPKLTLPRIDLKRLIVRTFTPFRLLMLAVVASVAVAGWLMISQRQFDQAQKDWLESTTAISERLEDGKLAGILPELQRAIQAGDVLEKDGAEFRRVNNLLKETQGFEALSPTGLVDIFHSAYDNENHLKADAAEQVKGGCASGWFLLDAQVIHSNSDSNSWLIDFPVTPGLHPVSITLPAESISSLFQNQPKTRIVFAAQLEVQTVPRNNEDGEWILAAKQDSFAVMTHPAFGRAAGFNIDDDSELTQMIERQRQWVENASPSGTPESESESP